MDLAGGKDQWREGMDLAGGKCQWRDVMDLAGGNEVMDLVRETGLGGVIFMN